MLGPPKTEDQSSSDVVGQAIKIEAEDREPFKVLYQAPKYGR